MYGRRFLQKQVRRCNRSEKNATTNAVKMSDAVMIRMSNVIE